MEGWNAFAKALCDNLSLASIFSSNHSLYKIVDSNDPYYRHIVESLLIMNREKNKTEVIRNKVLKFFFTDTDSLERTYADVVMMVMPDVIGWIGRDCLGFSTMYVLLHSMPWCINIGANYVPLAAEPPAKVCKV